MKKENGALFDSNQIIFQKPLPGSMVKNISIIKDWPNYDLALLKADFDLNKNRHGFVGKNGFDYIEIEFNVIPEGTEVYSFGYPLPDAAFSNDGIVSFGLHYYCPRTTSAVISSHYEYIGPVFSPGFPRYYIIDKALNYGNSGGPIVVNEIGKVISVCVRFQPVEILS